MISSEFGSTFSRIFPLLRLSLRLCETSKLLLGGVWLLVRRGFFNTLPLVSPLFPAVVAARGESIAVFEKKLWVRLDKVFSLLIKASYASRAPMQSPRTQTYKSITHFIIHSKYFLIGYTNISYWL